MTPQAATYRALAKLAARHLGRVEGVLGVYARRSVATGEVAFGRSDIDLQLLIAQSPSPEEEGRLLGELVVRYNRMRRLVPALGHAWVSTRDDLDRWYRDQPAEWYRDRAWLRLYGEEFERPRGDLGPSDHEGLLWWYVWAMGILPESLRRGKARRCWNLVLDMFDVYRLHAKLHDGPLGRAALSELWRASTTPTHDRELIWAARRRGFRSAQEELLSAIYRESLTLHELLFQGVEWQLEGRATGRLDSRVPPLFVPRTYLLAELSSGERLTAGFQEMRRNPNAWLLNESGLKLHLAYRNPWEYAPLAAANPELEVLPPSSAMFEGSLRRALHREIPRTFGFMGEPGLAGPLYAQRRLYGDGGPVATSPAELGAAYATRYGDGLDTDVPVQEFFVRSYPTICGIIDELRARRAVPAGTG